MTARFKPATFILKISAWRARPRTLLKGAMPQRTRIFFAGCWMVSAGLTAMWCWRILPRPWWPPARHGIFLKEWSGRMRRSIPALPAKPSRRWWNSLNARSDEAVWRRNATCECPASTQVLRSSKGPDYGLPNHLKILLEELEQARVQVSPHGISLKAVFLSRLNVKIEGLSGLHESLHKVHGVLHVNVVIIRAMNQEQFRLQLIRGFKRRCVFVACGILFGRSHVTLGVNTVVEFPIGHRPSRRATLKNIGRMRQRIQSHIAAVRPAPNAQTIAINIRKRYQIR